MTTNASRAQVDFDAFARDLQQPRPVASGKPESGKSDPLAELARIVGQDDPFRALLEARDSRGAAARGRIEPSFLDAPAPRAETPANHAPAPVHPAATPADAFDQYLASVDQGGDHGDGLQPDAAAFDSHDAADRARPAERPRHRSRLVSVGAGLGVLAVCVTGALAWRGLHGSHGGSGGVPTILADTAPLKIAPQKADGVEIPDQNKQIYDRTAKDGQIRIVNREEQPLDVTQAARAAGRTGEGGATPGNATPQQTGTLTESLGEPRRVRTVSVKPDTPAPPPQPAPEAAAVPVSPIPTMTMPGGDGSTATASVRPRPGRAAAMPAPSPVSAPLAEAPAPEPVVPAPAPVRAKAPQRVAAVTPEATSALPAPPAVKAAAAPPAGSFSVQLGVRTSEGEAQAAFKQMQGKYSQLSGQPALIRQAEVNGKTIYRVRVGPLGKNEATSLCTELQGAGGQCFVAKN